mmetsp:Transcript_36158/g.41940  ORF Transcript_36158/g.41940 Transcript_36158/m.41940 type:complete len:201 (+) Transcript_36158:182-784(+)
MYPLVVFKLSNTITNEHAVTSTPSSTTLVASNTLISFRLNPFNTSRIFFTVWSHSSCSATSRSTSVREWDWWRYRNTFVDCRTIISARTRGFWFWASARRRRERKNPWRARAVMRRSTKITPTRSLALRAASCSAVNIISLASSMSSVSTRSGIASTSGSWSNCSSNCSNFVILSLLRPSTADVPSPTNNSLQNPAHAFK